jgi:hypothetical protein
MSNENTKYHNPYDDTTKIEIPNTDPVQICNCESCKDVREQEENQTTGFSINPNFEWRSTSAPLKLDDAIIKGSHVKFISGTTFLIRLKYFLSMPFTYIFKGYFKF